MRLYGKIFSQGEEKKAAGRRKRLHASISVVSRNYGVIGRQNIRLGGARKSGAPGAKKERVNQQGNGVRASTGERFYPLC